MIKKLFLFPVILLLASCSIASLEENQASGGIDSVTSSTKSSKTAIQEEYNYNVELTSEEAIQKVQGTDPNAIVTSINIDEDNGYIIYDLDIISNNSAYDVKLDANTGEIVEWKISN